MSVRFCQHTKVDGTFRQAPPLNGRRPYCRWHLDALGRRMAMARARARREPYHLVLPILEDLNAVEVARMQVMDALNAGHIDAKHAGVLLFGLQGIASDLRSDKAPRMSAYDPAIDTALRAEDYPDFEERYGLPKDLDFSQRPEVVFAAEAAQAAAEAEAAAAAARLAYRSRPRHEVTREDIELEEILITKGEEACQKRALEMEKKEWKRIEQEWHKVDEARQTLEAARRNEYSMDPKLKAHYDKLWAEAVAKAQAEARKAAESAGAAEDTPAAGEAA
jgi:hypothetical protein